MSGWLLDVNVLLGCAWKSHSEHAALLRWLMQVREWATCSFTESAFVRISMTRAYRASFEDARRSVATLRALQGHRFVSDEVHVALLPVLTSYKDTTDAHLVTLAKWHRLRLATLDEALIGKPWTAGVAENPLLEPVQF